MYSRRVTDADYFLIAEVTSRASGLCSYEDANVLESQTYEYYVSAVDFDTGIETASDHSVEVFVPAAIVPPAPNAFRVVALDNANYLAWGDGSREAGDFSHYQVYLDDGTGNEFLLGDTDSEGFLDLLAENGVTYSYFVTAVDTDGHESSVSLTAQGTPPARLPRTVVVRPLRSARALGLPFRGGREHGPDRERYVVGTALPARGRRARVVARSGPAVSDLPGGLRDHVSQVRRSG